MDITQELEQISATETARDREERRRRMRKARIRRKKRPIVSGGVLCAIIFLPMLAACWYAGYVLLSR